MEKLYVISICLKINRKEAIFHFKGFYAGHMIKEIHLPAIGFEKSECYLIKIYNPKVVDQVLYGDCEKAKKLFS